MAFCVKEKLQALGVPIEEKTKGLSLLSKMVASKATKENKRKIRRKCMIGLSPPITSNALRVRCVFSSSSAVGKARLDLSPPPNVYHPLV